MIEASAKPIAWSGKRSITRRAAATSSACRHQRHQRRRPQARRTRPACGGGGRPDALADEGPGAGQPQLARGGGRPDHPHRPRRDGQSCWWTSTRSADTSRRGGAERSSCAIRPGPSTCGGSRPSRSPVRSNASRIRQSATRCARHSATIWASTSPLPWTAPPDRAPATRLSAARTPGGRSRCQSGARAPVPGRGGGRPAARASRLPR